MTTAIVAAVEEYNEKNKNEEDKTKVAEPFTNLLDPEIGKPISHEEVLAIAKCLKTHKEEATKYRLDHLLRGSGVYIPPPKPKAEKVRRVAAILLTMTTTTDCVVRPPSTKNSWHGCVVRKKRAYTIK